MASTRVETLPPAFPLALESLIDVATVAVGSIADNVLANRDGKKKCLSHRLNLHAAINFC